MEFRKLKASEIDCRIAQIGATWLTLLLYKDARVDMNILDETVGIMNWQKHYSRDNANCTVSIWDEEKKQWVEKEDTGTESFSEAEKGLASDSFKRACFCLGIGRELYTAPSIFILSRKDMIPKGKESEFYCKNPNESDDSKKRYDTKTRFWVEYIDYNEDREIQNLIIRDNKNNTRFTQLTKEKEKELLELNQKFLKLDEEEREEIYKKYQVEDSQRLLISQLEEIVNDKRRSK